MKSYGEIIADKIVLASNEFMAWRRKYIEMHGKNEYGNEIDRIDIINKKYKIKSNVLVRIFKLDRKPELDAKYRESKGIA